MSVRVPDGFEDAVRSVTLEVLVPAAGAFTCDGVAFQDVSPSAINVSRIQTTTVAVGASAPLSGIPREGTKLLLATGIGVDDLPIIRGCAEVGTIDGDVAVEIVGEPITILDADGPALGQPLPAALRVTLTDLVGRPQSGAAVPWRLIGPASSGDEDTAVTNAQGIAMIPIAAPDVPGPVALIPAARWMVDPPSAVIGFTPLAVAEVDIPNAPADFLRGAPRHVIGRVGPAGQIGLALLSEPSAGGAGRSVLIAYREGDEFVTVESPPVLALSVLGINPLAQRDEVFGVVGDRWLEFRTDGTVGVTPLTTSGITADEIGAAGPCPGAPGEGIALVRSDDAWVAIDANRQEVATEFADPPSGATGLIGTGCVTTTTGALSRTVVYARDRMPPQVKADVAGVLQTTWPTNAASVGFARPLPGRSVPLLGVEVDTAGVSIVRYELFASGGGLQLQEIDSDDAITLPQGPAGGDVDGDGLLDIVAALPIGENEQGVRVRIMVALGVTTGKVEGEGPRLAGVSDEIVVTGNAKLTLVDIDADGVDDVVVVSEDQILVFDMGGAR